MSDMILIIQKELMIFLKSDKATFFVYLAITIGWSIFLVTDPSNSTTDAPTLWFVFFSVIISGNFSVTTFVSERINGTLEILLTSGLSRKSILAGKILFVLLASIAMGFLCFGIASAIGNLQNRSIPLLHEPASRLLLYSSACFLNAAIGAFLSLRLNNPRLLHVVNLLIMAIIVTIYALCAVFFPISWWLLTIVLFIIGTTCTIAAIRDFESERIVHPIVY